MISKRFCKILFAIILSLNLSIFNANANVLYNSIDSFILKTYDVFLNRDGSEDEGFKYWSYSIRNHNKSLYEYMVSLVSGEEFLMRELSDEEFISMMYKVLFDKDPNDEEIKHWLGEISRVNESLKDLKKSRIEIAKAMFNEPFFKEFSNSLNVTSNFENLNIFGVEELKKSYPDEKIKYINSVYKSFEELRNDYLNSNYSKISNREQFLEYISSILPIFMKGEDGNKYEELKNVSGDKVERLVHELDYEISFPYNEYKSVYISPFIQMNDGENLKFVTLGLGVTGRGLGKKITKAELILGDESIKLDMIYNDQEKYNSKGISANEFNFNVKSIKDLETLDKMMGSDLTKLRFEFDDSDTYVYSLYDKDRVKNTLKFMFGVYSQIMVSHLIESKDVFDGVVVNSLN